jgi:hypothetical protein
MEKEIQVRDEAIWKKLKRVEENIDKITIGLIIMIFFAMAIVFVPLKIGKPSEEEIYFFHWVLLILNASAFLTLLMKFFYILTFGIFWRISSNRKDEILRQLESIEKSIAEIEKETQYIIELSPKVKNSLKDDLRHNRFLLQEYEERKNLLRKKIRKL